MITPEINNNYVGYANELFSFFNGYREGQGGYVMRTMRGRYGKINQQEHLSYLRLILYNLCENGYLEPKDVDSQFFLDGWISLTAKGADYIQGGPLMVNKIDFNQYILLTDPDNKQFDDLWQLIGEKEKAPFYLKGPTFLNMIRYYITEYVSDYITYMDERKQKELSTSRRVWYKELYLKVSKDKRHDFLVDLSYVVSLSYYYEEEKDEDYAEMLREQMEAISQQINYAVPILPGLKINETNKRQTPEELMAISLEICNAYKSLIENNRLYKLLYNDDASPKKETDAQLLFFSIAQGYCDKYNIDINRESDPGIGELDFKFSVGHTSKVIIEMKLSSNNTLKHGFEKQFPAYLRAEDTRYGIFLVIQMNKIEEKQLTQVKEGYKQLSKDENYPIQLICIDATPKPSASKI